MHEENIGILIRRKNYTFLKVSSHTLSNCPFLHDGLHIKYYLHSDLQPPTAPALPPTISPGPNYIKTLNQPQSWA